MYLKRLMWLCTLCAWSAVGCGGGDTEAPEEKKSPAEIAAAQGRVRSCELLVKNTAGDVLKSVAFGSGVVGFSQKRGDLSAIVFVARKDEPIDSGAVTLSMSSGQVSGLELDTTKSRCFDSAGTHISGVFWKL